MQTVGEREGEGSMTDREKAIVMAHTGICMLTGYKFQIFHKYVEDIMGRPIMTHEIGWLVDTIKEKSKADFIALCADENSSEKPNKWIPVSERLPEKGKQVLCCNRQGSVFTSAITYKNASIVAFGQHCNVIAWMPLPEPYKAQERSE